MADSVNAVDHCCVNVPNVSSSSRDLALAAFLAARLSCRFFEQRPSMSCAVPGVLFPGSCLRFFDVLGAIFPPRLELSIADTFPYLRAISEHFYFPRFGSHFFVGGGVLTLLQQARLPQETILLCWDASPPVDAVDRLALSASTCPFIHRRHAGNSIHAKTQ